jgi:hypothetical protein
MYQNTNGSNEAYRYIYNLLNDFSQKNGSTNQTYIPADNMAYVMDQNKRAQCSNYDLRRNVISGSFDNINVMSDQYVYRARTAANRENDENYQYRNVNIRI